MNELTIKAAPSSSRSPAFAAPPCDCAVVDDLVDYMNEHLNLIGSGQAEPFFSAQSGRLLLRGNRVEAEVGPFTLRSEQHRIAPVTAPSSVGAYYSALRVNTQSGRELSADSLLRLQPTEMAAVAMDRLCRVLHMLNHLACARDNKDLWVHTSLRHVLAVEGRHGAFFEDLLRRCGLGPERIVLIAPLLPVEDADFERIVAAYENYASRGFRLTLDISAPPTAVSAKAIARLAPGMLRVRHRDLAAIRALGLPQPLLIRDVGRGASVSEASFGRHDLLELYDSLRPVFLP